MDWHEQQPKIELAALIDEIRISVYERRFDTRDWDHNSPNYRAGRSNKQVKIWAAILLRREPTMDEAWGLLINMAIGPCPLIRN